LDARSPAGPFLRLDRLAAGDIVLMRGRGLGSSIIAVGTEGKFSHAALVLNLRGSLTLFDSLDTGIGQMSLILDAFGDVNGETAPLMELPDASAFAVFYHPLIKHVLESKLLEESERLVRDYSGKQYSRHERLPGALRRFKPLAPALGPLFRAFDRRYHPEGVYGPFCSELVMIFFEKLELHVFDNLTSSDSVAPNDLTRSRLVPKDGAVIAGGRFTHFTRIDHGLARSANEWRSRHAEMRTSLAELQNLNDELEEQNRNASEGNRKSAEILVQGSLITWGEDQERIKSLTWDAGETYPRHSRRLSRLHERYESLIGGMRQFMVLRPEMDHAALLEVVKGINRTNVLTYKISQMDLLLKLRKLSDAIRRGEGRTPGARWRMSRLMKRLLSLYRRNREVWREKYMLAMAAEQQLVQTAGRIASARTKPIDPS
jgi:hypothetical protein